MRAGGSSLQFIGRMIVSREVLMVAAAVGSKWLTPAETYHRNEFSYTAIKEVAILFLGIFSTMAPALQWLQANAEKMPLKTPGQYYFTCGALSSFLDNAPTYLTFLQTELGALDQKEVDVAAAELEQMSAQRTLNVRPGIESPAVRLAVEAMVKYHPNDVLRGKLRRAEVEVGFLVGVERNNTLLVAISLAAVFFGACTYIGNGPNFMVKSIADGHGAKTPSFVAYIVRFSLPILIPTYVIVWWIFLR
jgi:Na+/H+ antiporter NhaD/arsenite permease-like protein